MGDIADLKSTIFFRTFVTAEKLQRELEILECPHKDLQHMGRCKMVLLFPKTCYNKYSELYWLRYVHFNYGATFRVGIHPPLYSSEWKTTSTHGIHPSMLFIRMENGINPWYSSTHAIHPPMEFTHGIVSGIYPWYCKWHPPMVFIHPWYCDIHPWYSFTHGIDPWYYNIHPWNWPVVL